MEILFKNYIEKYPLVGGEIYFDWFLKIKPDANYVYFKEFNNWFLKNQETLLKTYTELIETRNIEYQQELNDLSKKLQFRLPTLEDFEDRGKMFDTSPQGGWRFDTSF